MYYARILFSVKCIVLHDNSTFHTKRRVADLRLIDENKILLINIIIFFPSNTFIEE